MGRKIDIAVLIYNELVGIFIFCLGLFMAYYTLMNVAGMDLPTIVMMIVTGTPALIKLYIITGLIIMLWPIVAFAFSSFRRAAITISILLVGCGFGLQDWKVAPLYFVVAAVSFTLSFLKFD